MDLRTFQMSGSLFILIHFVDLDFITRHVSD